MVMSANPNDPSSQSVESAPQAVESDRQAEHEKTESSSLESSSADATASSAADHSAAATDKSESKILIGSQRDVAKPVMQRSAAALQDGTLASEKLVTAVKTGSVALKESASADHADAASVSAATFAAPSPAADMEQELEAALQDLSVDSLLATGGEVESELEIDARIKGTVVRIHGDHVFLSLKGRFEGVTSLRHFQTPPAEGDLLEVKVIGRNEEDGLYEVSIPGAAVSVGDWSDLVEGAIVDVRISGSNTGGLECMINQIRGFIPASPN